jgi:hypothetical protein
MYVAELPTARHAIPALAFLANIGILFPGWN